ncbi:hypothetical protein RUM44_012035 [Polyplax serrata]|uniref:VWFA domain-containing protein n=1 Tax=Polyplax serrata TaxID=468196 RepID=A0ABR1BA61_POLSC
MAYQNLILEKCEDSQELISNLGKLNEERMALQKVIDEEEKEKARLEKEAEDILEKLTTITASLNRKMAARVEFDRTISQGEMTVKNLLETYKNITGVLRSRFSDLTNDEKTIVTAVGERIPSKSKVEGGSRTNSRGKRRSESYGSTHANEISEEKDGIETSDNFDGKAQDIEKPEDDEEGNESENDEEEEDDADMEMGETEPGADKLESEMWSDSEDDEEDNTEKREDSGGKGEEAEQDKYAAKNDGEDENDQSDEKSGGDKEKKQKKKDINEMDDAEDNGDQIDPYHGNHPPEQEPEPLDLPDDMQLDDGEAKGEDPQEENPFDIDAMKQQQPPMEADEEQENERKTNEDDKIDKESDSDENDKEDEHTEPMEVDEEEGDDEESGESDDNGTTKRCGGDEKNEEKMEEEVTQNDDFRPSDDKPSEMAAQAAPDTNIEETMSRDQVVGGDDTKPNEFQPQETSQKTDMEPKGVGQAEIEGTKQGHDAATSKKEKLKSGQAQEKRERKRERPGKSDDDRCLGDAESTVNKKLKTLDRMEEKEMETQTGAENENESEIYQHISEKVKDAVQVLDAATKVVYNEKEAEQAESQCVPKGEDEEEESGNEEDLAMDVEVEESMNVEKTNEQKPTEVEGKKSQKGNKENEGGDPVVEEVKHETSGEVVETVTVSRGPETTFHTQLSALKEEKGISLQPEEVEALRREIQEQLQLHKQSAAPAKSIQAWQLLTSVTDGLARDLSEQLRVILEPTRATRLKGDYRTGRRINMRKVISYIASEFRKDNIWLRRTKPWKREYEIVLAIDDSHSMFHNESRELAFESLALVSKALDLIEAGRLGVLSFGEKTNIVHRLGDPFSEDVGARVINEFTFVQNKTLLCEMLDVSTTMMTSEKKSDAAQLLLIISDGRGVFSEGLERVKEAVRRATDSGIFLVFIIIDNPTSKDSIMDIRMPEFNDGKFVSMKSYMEQFPFPYYLILRDITQLPSTLSGALRQWFQLITCDRTDRWWATPEGDNP